MHAPETGSEPMDAMAALYEVYRVVEELGRTIKVLAGDRQSELDANAEGFRSPDGPRDAILDVSRYPWGQVPAEVAEGGGEPHGEAQTLVRADEAEIPGDVAHELTTGRPASKSLPSIGEVQRCRRCSLESILWSHGYRDVVRPLGEGIPSLP